MNLQDYAKALGLPLTVDIELEHHFTHYPMQPEYITIHNARSAGDGRNLHDYNRYSIRTSGDGVKSWHWSVGEDGAFQALPMDINAWHAGDGNGDGNRASIAIEISRDLATDRTLYDRAEDNGAKLAAILLKAYGLSVEALRTHYDWSGKWCPHVILTEQRLGDFKARVAGYLARLNATVTTGSEAGTSDPAAMKPAEHVIYRLQLGAFGKMENAQRYKDICTRVLKEAGVITDNPQEAPFLVTVSLV